MKTAFFMAHGAPTIYLDSNTYTEKLKRFKKEYPMIKRLLFFSAHNDSSIMKIAQSETYSTIHDFYGFPDEIYQVKMTTKGDPDLALDFSSMLKTQGVDHETVQKAGLDHGVWTIIKLIDPEDELKVVNVSISSRANPKDYLKLGGLIADWIPEDTALIFSGGLIHNLRAVKFNSTQVDAWATSFHKDLELALANPKPEALLDLLVHPEFPLAAPTPEHFIGIYIVYGTIVKKGIAKRLHQLFQFGNLSLDYWSFTRE